MTREELEARNEFANSRYQEVSSAGGLLRSLSKLEIELQAKEQENNKLISRIADITLEKADMGAEISRLNTVLINKGVEIAELKEQLANKGSCEGCLYQDWQGQVQQCMQCKRCYMVTDHYTPKESK